MEIDDITRTIIGAAIEVHRELGPGLLESAYQACMAYELISRGAGVQREKAVPLMYKGVRIDCGYRMDLLIEDRVVVELKSVDRLEPIHTAKVLTYLKLSGHHVALLINFNVPRLRDGVRRLVLGYSAP